MPLNNVIAKLVDKKLVKKENIRLDQISKLLIRANKDLKAAEANLVIDEEIAYTCAYLAMLRTGRALMFTEGYRPIDGAQHKTVIEFAGAVLGENFTKMIKKFDNMRQKRNEFTYEPDIPISPTEALEALNVAKEWVSQLQEILKQKNPQIHLF
jgi:uncharacterized protein (UPF0332 family)